MMVATSGAGTTYPSGATSGAGTTYPSGATSGAGTTYPSKASKVLVQFELLNL